ncbi:MAG TPA: PH domain-containing protein [Thermoanaerobaculia bacterium]
MFRSKVDAWLLWLVRLSMVGTIALVLIAVISQGEAEAAWPAIAIVLVAYAFVEWIFQSTYYMVDQDYLRIRSGPFRWRVLISEIESIAPSSSVLSSPALSLDRLRVSYRGGRSILVSPGDRASFVDALRSVNAAIRVE